MEAFAWLGHIIESLGCLIPRFVIVRVTHRGVRWVFGHSKEMKPGFHMYWPLIEEVDQIVVARQTLNLPTQVLMSADGKQLVIGCLIVYRIKDVIRAIGERNYDVDGTVSDITQAAIVEVCSSTTFEGLRGEIAGDVEKRLTQTTRKRLRQFGVYVHRCAITDFSTCRVYKVLGDGETVNHI